MSEPSLDLRTFPDDWPEGCPPTDAAATAGDYYRVTRREVPTAEDFRSHRELEKLPKAPPCLRAGLSTFRALEEAERMALLFPVLGAFVAMGRLDAAYGLSLLTPGREPTHTTVWPYMRTDRASPFLHVCSVRRPS